MLVEDEDGALDSVMLSMEAGFEATVLHSTQSIHCTLLKICFMNCQIPHDVLPLVDLYLISEKSIWKNPVEQTGEILNWHCSNVPTNPITITRIIPHWPMEKIKIEKSAPSYRPIGIKIGP